MDYADNIYVARGRDLTGFRAILNSYIEVELQYMDIMDNDDFAFYYGEQPCVANFAAAAIENGWAALCEFGHRKIKKGNGRENSEGRGDLYLAKSDREFFLEAKYKSITPTATAKGWQGEIKRTLQEAEEDTKNSITNRRKKNDSGIALSFFCLKQNDKDYQSAKEFMASAKNYLNENDYIDAIAYYLLPKSRFKKLSDHWKKDYPLGFIVTLQRVDE